MPEHTITELDMVYLAPIEPEEPRSRSVNGDGVEAGKNLVHGRFASPPPEMSFRHSHRGVQHAEVRFTILV